MSSTARQVENAINLVIAGAMREVDNGTGTVSYADIMYAVGRALSDWLDNDEEIAADLVAELFVEHIRDKSAKTDAESDDPAD